MPDGELTLVGDKAKKTMAEYKDKLADYNNNGVTKEPDDVFLEVAGGLKKGKVYGLGNAASIFYESGSSSQPKQSTYATSMLSVLRSQLEECKKMVEESKKVAENSKNVAEECLKVAQSYKEAHEKEKGEWKKEKEEIVDSMTKMKQVVAEVFQLILKERSFNPHDPRGSSTGGSQYTTL